MGCASSSGTKVAPESTRRPRRSISHTPRYSSSGLDSETVHSVLLEKVKAVPTFPEAIPLLSLSSSVVPLLTVKLNLHEIGPTSIRLPIVSVVIHKEGLICCWSHRRLTSSGAGEDVQQFIRNLMSLSKRGSFILALLLLDMPKDMHTSFDVFAKIGATIDVGGFQTRFDTYPVIAIPSDIDLQDEAKILKLEKFVAEGGILVVVCHTRDDETFGVVEEPVNVLLKRHGFAFAQFAIGHDTSDPLKVQMISVNEGRDLNLSAIARSYIELLKDPDIDLEVLDDLVTSLHYYFKVSRPEDVSILQEVAFDSFEFVKKRDVRKDGMIYPDSLQRIILIMLAESLAVMRQYTCRHHLSFVAPYVDLFPGVVEAKELGEFEVNVKIDTQRLISTGLWCVAGEKCEITIENDSDVPIHEWLSVQIGSHTADLLVKPGPWRRFPNVVICFDINGQTMECGSPFGGILYFAVQDLPHSQACDVTVKIKNVCQYPFYDVNRPELYEQTKNSPVPWVELMGRNIIFTARKDDVKKVLDISRVLNFYDNLIDRLAAFMNCEILRQFRVVFDVETEGAHEDEPQNEYPITMTVESFDDLFVRIHTPTKALFLLAMTLAKVSLVEDCFDECTETGLAALVASCLIGQLFPEFNPIVDLDVRLPLLFPDFWRIQRWCNPNVLCSVIRKSQNPPAEEDWSTDEVDRWVKFVIQLCEAGETNYAALFEKKRIVPLNAQAAVRHWPEPVFSTTMYDIPT